MPALRGLSTSVVDSDVLRKLSVDCTPDDSRALSPDTPPYSPITPVMASSTLPQNRAEQQYAPESDKEAVRVLIPFSESDNSDAIALRSAISILQLQRQQSVRDLKTLERQKTIAVADPKSFAAEVAVGRVKTVDSRGLIAPMLDNPSEADVEDSYMNASVDRAERSLNKNPKFGDIPGPQSIVRTPPINWAKYHILGEPLERLHEEQKANPAPSQPRTGKENLSRSPHMVAGPYSPWKDKLPDPSARTRGTFRKDS